MSEDSALPAVLYKASRSEPPFSPPCSWSPTYTEASRWKWSAVFNQGGPGRIWVADIPRDSTFLDARSDPGLLAEALGGIAEGEVVNKVVRERVERLREQGWNWIAFKEDNEVGAEFIYVFGPDLEAEEASE